MIYLFIFRIIAYILQFILMAISKKSHWLMKITPFYWFFEAILFMNLEIPVYKLNNTLNLLSIFRFLSILLLFSQDATSEKQRKFHFLLFLITLCNLCFVISIDKSYEFFGLVFEIPLFLLSIVFFTRKQAQKQEENLPLLHALNSSKEGSIILEEKKHFVYELRLFNEEALNMLGINEKKSKIDFTFLNKNMHGFRMSKIPKKNNNIEESPSETLEKNSIEKTQIFSNLSEILLFIQQKNKENESFYFSRLLKNEPSSPKNEVFSQNLILIIKRDLIHEKTFYFFSFRKVDSPENHKGKKNETNTRLMNSLSHEIKTPLNSTIPLLSEVLQGEKPQNKDYIGKALSCLKILENSLNNILDYSLILSEQFLINLGFVNLYELLQEVSAIIKEQVELKGLEFTVEIDDSFDKTQCIYSDYIRLRQVLLNILLNAIQFTNRRGKISLAISIFSLEPLAIECRITDTGIGIPQEKLLKLKENLLKNEEITLNSTGSCLGLIISQNIASLLGKNGLEINSNEKTGTCVRFIVADQSNYEDFKGFNPENLIEKANKKLKEKEEEKITIKIDDNLNENLNLTGILNEKLNDNLNEKFIEILKENLDTNNNTKFLNKIQKRNKKILKDSRVFDSMRRFNQSSSKLSETLSENQRNLCSFSKKSGEFHNASSVNSQFKMQSSVVINQRKSFFYSRKIEEVSKELSMEQKVHAYDFDHLVKFKTINTKISSELDSDSDIDIDIKPTGNLKLLPRGTLYYLNLESFSQIYTINNNKENSANVTKACLCEDILIVDDDVFNLYSLEIMLKSLNFSCKKASNGQEAIEILKNFKKCHEKCKGIRLVFMDYQMPVLDGVESTKEIRNMILKGEIKEIPVIGCTAFTAKNEVLKCLEAGMKDIFFKPLNRNVIQGIIKQWM